MKAELERLTQATAPALVKAFGIGPDTAAALLIAAGSNPDRLHSEAAFASLCGVSPVPASSGKTNRHRLNRGRPPGQCGALSHSRRQTVSRSEDAGVWPLRRPVFWGNARGARGGERSQWLSFGSHHSFTLSSVQLSCRLHVRKREVLTLVKKRLSGYFRQSVCETVPEVQARRVIALAEPPPRPARCLRMLH